MQAKEKPFHNSMQDFSPRNLGTVFPQECNKNFLS